MKTLPIPARYDLLGPLGEGGMGLVFRVHDREIGREIALKRLRLEPGTDEAQARFLFRQEFWAMASLRHPHLVEALDFGECPDGVPYMTMALVPGEDLDVTPPGQAESVVRAWLPQIASALAFLHGRGFVHGDLKPDNLRLQPDGGAKLMDLGLLAPAGRAGEPIRGSIAYMAPEVIKQGAIDARSDLYALGAVLYHALTGRAPFESANPMVVLRAHLDTRPERLQARNSDVSAPMDAAVLRLLSKEPSARFASVGDLLAALGLEAEGTEQARLLASPILGREEVQAALRATVGAVSHADASASGKLWLVGPSGAGKTRLLGETRAEAQLAGLSTIALHGRGVDAAPYQALLPLFRALADEAMTHQTQLAPVLARVLPELEVAPAAPLDGVSERLRLQSAVASLARAVYPTALWLIDGGDTLDPASSELLTTLQKEQAAAWAWVWAGEAAPEGAEVLELAPLADEAVLAIAREQLGQQALPAGLADTLLPLAGGWPGAIEALLGHWLRSGALERMAGRWEAVGTLELPGGLKVALDARLAELGEDARQVARTAAILGATADLRWLAGIAGLSDDRFFAALRELVAAEVLASEEGTFHFSRATQAVALAASWDTAERQRLHDAAADWLAAEVGEGSLPLADALALAHHALSGATPRRALHWVRTAAAEAIAQFTLEPADALLRRALAVDGLSDDERLALDRLQANVWRHQGRGKEALARYADTDLLGRLERSEDPSLAEETTSYGALLSVVGRYDEAQQVLADAIKLADARQDAATAVRARIYAGRAAYFTGDPAAAKAILAEAVEQGRKAHQAGTPVMLAVALSFYGYFQASGGAAEEGLAALAEAVAVAQETGNPVQANEALSMRGNVCMAEGRPLEAKAAFEGILATCRRFELPYDELMARLNLSGALLDLGDAPAARAHADQVALVSRSRQRKFPEAYARAVAGRARIQMGELAEGEAEMSAGLAIAREIANRYLELHILAPWCDALVAMGRLDAAQAALAEARKMAAELKNTEHDEVLERIEMRAALAAALAPDAPLADLAIVGERLAGWAARLRTSGRRADLAHALVLQAAWAHRCSNLAPGVTWVDEALALAEEAGLGLVAAEALYVRARLSVAAAQVNSSVSGLIEAAVAGFARAGERAQALGDVRLDALCTAGALIAQGLIRELPPVARRLEALTQGLAPEQAAAFMGHPDLQEVTRTLPPIMGLSREARDVLGLMATFDEPEALPLLLKRAVATMVEFAGAKRGFVLLFEDMDVTHKVVYGMKPWETDDFSTSLAYQVLWTEAPLFVEDAQSDGTFAGAASVRALDLRSVVGVPLTVDGVTVGVMIADSQYVTASFGDFHLDLLVALARRVAGAIGAARRKQEEDRRVAISDMLERLAIATAGCVDLEEFMAPVAAEALELADAERLCLVVGPELVCRAAFDRSGRVLDPAQQSPSQSACRWVYEHGEPLHLHDAMTSETFSAQKSVMALGLRTIHAVPVSHQNRTLGVLYLDDRRVGIEDPHVIKALQRVGAMVGALLTRRGLIGQ